jgi:hypothetical protein
LRKLIALYKGLLSRNLLLLSMDKRTFVFVLIVNSLLFSLYYVRQFTNTISVPQTVGNLTHDTISQTQTSHIPNLTQIPYSSNPEPFNTTSTPLKLSEVPKPFKVVFGIASVVVMCTIIKLFIPIAA